MNIEHLYESNNPPSSSEEVVIHARIAECNLEIAAIDAEIEKLERKRLPIEEGKKSHVGVLSVLRKFPSELIGEIFRHMLPTDAGINGLKKQATVCHLMRLATLGRVSRRWNQILYSMPRLCTDLLLWVACDDLVPCLQWWMKLSRRTSLSLTVSASSGEDKSAFAETIRFLSIILNDKTVWKELTLRFPCADVFMVCDSASENHWGILEALSLGSRYGIMLPRKGKRPIHMGQFPRLKSLYLKYKDVILPHHFDLPWSKLTDLTLELDNNVEEYIWVIQHCPDLESLHLTIYNMDPIPTTPLPSVIFSNLQRLSVTLKDVSGFQFFHPIQCPALTSLQIYSDQNDSDALHAFFSKTTALTELRLNVHLDDNDLVYLLKETRSLAVLRIQAQGVNGEFLRPLKNGHLTKLHTLDIKGSPDERSRREFNDFVRSRRTESTTDTRLERAFLNILQSLS